MLTTTIGKKIIQRRKEMHCSQQRLADMCGVTKRTIASYETDGRQPRESTLKKLAAALGCSVDYLSNDTLTEFCTPTKEELYLTNVRDMYGRETADEIETLLKGSAALFAGGRLSQEAKDRYYEALTSAYMACKKAENKDRD
ncbi:MAG TPA: helix-turn-helix transcriptional regulator [Candidatus Avilachnospira avicola]|nr:helix-turn-helix transcriptional regulator [Candidatus Avilachnospira avicola]